MKNSAILLLALLLWSATTFAATPKEIQSALAEKYEVTKRKLSGDVKAPGTVFYIRVPGLYAEPPRAIVPETIIENGSNQIQSPSAEREHSILLPVGEPMYVYSIRTKRNQVRLQLGTEGKYDYKTFGMPAQAHFQMAIVFEYEGGVEGLDVENVLSDISQIGATPEEALALPEIKAALERQSSEEHAERKNAEVSALREDSVEDDEPRQRAAQGSVAEREAAKRQELSRNHASVNFQVQCRDLFIPDVFEEKFRGLIPVYSMVVLNNSSRRYTVEYDLVYERNKEAVRSKDVFGTRIAGQPGYSETLTDTKQFSVRPSALTKFTIIEKGQSDGVQVGQIKAIDVFRCTTPSDKTPSRDRAPSADRYSDLERLKKLLDDGALTQEEYDKEKARILDD